MVFVKSHGSERQMTHFHMQIHDQKRQALLIIMVMIIIITRKEGNVLFNDALNTFYLRLYGVRHMV